MMNLAGVNRIFGNTVLGGSMSSVSKGRLTVYGSGAFTKNLSGNTLTFQSGGYLLGNVSIGKTTTSLAKLDVVGTISGSALVASAGSATTPSFSFNNDANTGLYWISAD